MRYSGSREGDRGGKKDEVRDVRSPSSEKRGMKPAWNVRKPVKPEAGVYKCTKLPILAPPPVEKKNYKQVQPKIVTRYDSKEKIAKVAASTP